MNAWKEWTQKDLVSLDSCQARANVTNMKQKRVLPRTLIIQRIIFTWQAERTAFSAASDHLDETS